MPLLPNFQLMKNMNMFPEAPVAPDCYFFRLPAELKLEVISYLDQKRDLYNVSQTCQWLESVALKALYSNVQIEIPAEKSPAWSRGDYISLRNHVIKSLRNVMIRDGNCSHTDLQYPKRKRFDIGCPEDYLMRLVEEAPANQLRTVSFMHRSAVSARTLQLLACRHGHSLRHLACYEINASPLLPYATPRNLQSLDCRSIGDAENLGRMVLVNKNSLLSLRLGEEKDIVGKYREHKTTFFETIPRSLLDFSRVVNLSEIANLRSLSLSGTDLRALVPIDIESALYLTSLEELTIESCTGCTEFLAAAGSIFAFAQSEACPEPRPLPVLRKFSLRHESTDAAMRDALLRFLTSFSGLTTLSLLFENGSMSLRLADLANNHGSTLEKLVLETRVQPRELLRLDTSRPFGLGGYSQQLWEEGTNDVCRLCPNLRELGIGFPWKDEMIRLRQSPLPSLKNLATMHIRNFPESTTLLHMGDYAIKEYAHKFIEWTFGNLVGGDRPQLETISIGPTIYESRFKGANPTRKQPPEFLRTHHFMVDWAQTRFKKWSAMVTPVSERYMEEMREERPLAGVFEPVWLR